MFPDVLIVGEALAVGDARLQAKCFARPGKLKENGTSILLVAHATGQIVTHCDAAVLLDSGALLAQGSLRKIVNRYLDLLFGKARVLSEGSTSVTPAVSVPVAASAHPLASDLNGRYEAHPYPFQPATPS